VRHAAPPPPALAAPVLPVEGPLHFRLFWKYFRQPVLQELLLQFFLFGLAFGLFMSGFALFAERRFFYQGHPFGAREVGYFYTYIGLFGIFVQGFLLGKLVKRFGEERLVWMGFLAQALGYGLLALVYRIPLLLLTSLVSAYGTGTLRPALTSLITQRASRTEQGAVLGVSQSLMSIALVLSPLLSGFLINHHWLNSWTLTAAGLSLSAFFTTGFFRRSPVPAAQS